MNWLAHVFLSPNNINFQMGNLLTDTLKPAQLEVDDEMFVLGVACHYEIDKFTDSHELVKKCKQVFFPKYRHFSAVLVDLFYDHFLASSWTKYSLVSYEEYVNEFYKRLKSRDLALSPEGDKFLESVINDDRLGFYNEITGVERTLSRVFQRIKINTKIDIRESRDDLLENFDHLFLDFHQFFPELRSHVEHWLRQRSVEC